MKKEEIAIKMKPRFIIGYCRGSQRVGCDRRGGRGEGARKCNKSTCIGER